MISEYFDFYNKYKDLKPKLQCEIREREHTNQLINMAMNILQFKGFPDTVRTKNISLYLILFGACAITKNEDDELIELVASPSGILTVNGEFDDVILNSLYNSYTCKRKNGIDCVVGYNNSLKQPDYSFERYAHMFSQIDLSMVYNIRYARMNRAFKVSDQRSKEQIENAIKQADNGQIVTFIDECTVNDLLNGKDDIEPILFTDVKDIDKIQYLSNFYDDILKRWCWEHGLSMQNSSKMAQQSIEEIANSDSGTTIIIDDMYDCAVEFCDKVNKLYGLNTSVEFGKAWERKQHQMDNCTEYDEPAEDELTEDEPTE